MRLELDGKRVVREERLLGSLGHRIRDVRSGFDGHLYLLTDASNGRVLKVELAKPQWTRRTHSTGGKPAAGGPPAEKPAPPAVRRPVR